MLHAFFVGRLFRRRHLQPHRANIRGTRNGATTASNRRSSSPQRATYGRTARFLWAPWASVWSMSRSRTAALTPPAAAFYLALVHHCQLAQLAPVVPFLRSTLSTRRYVLPARVRRVQPSVLDDPCLCIRLSLEAEHSLARAVHADDSNVEARLVRARKDGIDIHSVLPNVGSRRSARHVSRANETAARRRASALRPRCTRSWATSRGSLLSAADTGGDDVGALAVGEVESIAYNWPHGSAIPTHKSVAAGPPTVIAYRPFRRKSMACAS